MYNKYIQLKVYYYYFEIISNQFFKHVDEKKDVNGYLALANKYSERIWMWIFKFMVFGFVNYVSTVCVTIVICWYEYGIFDSKYVHHPFKWM